MLKLIECPRDAMQGIKNQIPTDHKIEYINSLLKIGFDTIDFGSFVSPKAIPQMADTANVLKGLDLTGSKSSLLAIIANKRGAEDAVAFDEIRYLGYPFSISDTFQQRNTGATIEESLSRLEAIKAVADAHGKEIVLYISMAFGNPYGDEYHPELAARWARRLHDDFGLNILALSDTIGSSNPKLIEELFTTLIPELPEVEFGAHLHTTPHTWKEKIEAAYDSGCRRFDGAIKGFGGCPMAKDELTGNMPTEKMVSFFNEKDLLPGFDMKAFEFSVNKSQEVFPL
jgi:hydroxymethylglutaryl-CoA lyase